MRPTHSRTLRWRAFTLIEVMVSFAVLSLILVLLLSMTDVTSKTWRRTTEKMQAFEEARSAFDRITTLVALATLNPYWDYDDMENPTRYERTSELQFLSLPMSDLGADARTHPTQGLFFQAPTGKVANPAQHGDLPLLLNAYGFFVEYGPDDRPSWLPAAVGAARYRFRLKEWRVPSEDFKLYVKTSGANGKNYLDQESYDWIHLNDPPPHTLAENIVALVILPKSPVNAATGTADNLVESGFVYNSRTSSGSAIGQQQRHQLPPEVEIIMVAIDETSALRKWNNSSTAPALVDAAWFKEPAQVDTDLENLTTKLNNEGIAHVVLRSTVKLRGSRWSLSQ